MLPNYKRPTFRKYLYDRLEEPLDDQDLDMIEYVEGLEEDIRFCINNMKNEYACTDSRTNRELHTMVKILEERLKDNE